MKSNSNNTVSGNKSKENSKQDSHAQNGKNMPNKKNGSVNIKDMPEIDHAKPGVV